MTVRVLARVGFLALIAACSSSPTGNDGRTTDTFPFTTTRLNADGSLSYPAGTTPVTFTVATAGLVEADVSIVPQLDCEYVLAIEKTTSSGNAILKTKSRSRTISVRGELEPGSYSAGVVGRDEGQSLCNGLPPQGVDFPHTIVVKHP